MGFVVLGSVILTGCGQFMGNLRRDLDDSEPYTQPTYGGRWAERGFLSDNMPEGPDRYAQVGHSERNPASDTARNDGDSWISPERAEANARDRYRYSGADDQDGQSVTMSNTPNLAPPVKRMYKNGARATRADFIDDTSNEGSLWGSDGQTNYYFTKNKVRGVGDLVTVTLEPDMLKDLSSEVKRTLTPKEREFELALAQERLKAKAMGLPDPDAPKKDAATPGTDQVATSQSSAQRAPAGTTAEEKKEPEIRQATPADVDVLRSLEVKQGDTIMSEITDRYPNGNYKIRGTKRIQYKGGPPRLITLVGVARGQDIGEDDQIASGKLYEYRIEAAH
jgi:flagellar basal body L-ring protein FlgH